MNLTSPKRAHLVATARQYIGTPFADQGRVKGLAVDCVGLVLSVAEDCGMHDIFDRPLLRSDYGNYSAQPMGDFVHQEVARRLIPKPIEQMQPGDILTLRVPTEPCHVAFISEIGRASCRER